MSLLLIMPLVGCNLHKESHCIHYCTVSAATDVSVVSGISGALPILFCHLSY